MQQNKERIRKASTADLDALLRLYQACTFKMNKAGLYNWHSGYPGRDSLISDIGEGSLYVLETENILAAVTLNEDQPAEYSSIHWDYHDPPYLVVHRLAVLPEQQGKGYAIRMMEFAEALAAEEGCPSIRMDVYTINTPGRSLYRKLGYRELNEFHFPGFEIPFIGLEKKISGSQS